MLPDSSIPSSIRLGAALVFHLPGVRMDLLWPDGSLRSVGMSTDRAAVLHPAELRDAIANGARASDLAGLFTVAHRGLPSPAIVVPAPWVRHLGGGLYRVSAPQGFALAFVTPLTPEQVTEAMAGSQTIPADAGYVAAGMEPDEGMERAIGFDLVADDALGVTLVLVYPLIDLPVSLEPMVVEVARSATAACAVGELEHAAG